MLYGNDISTKAHLLKLDTGINNKCLTINKTMDENYQIFYTNLISFCNLQNVHKPQIDIFYLI